MPRTVALREARNRSSHLDGGSESVGYRMLRWGAASKTGTDVSYACRCRFSVEPNNRRKVRAERDRIGMNGQAGRNNYGGERADALLRA
jgi:hypothetical protein